MADYNDITLPNGLTQEEIGKRIQGTLASRIIHSVEVLRDDDNDTLVLRSWFSTPYNETDHNNLGQ